MTVRFSNFFITSKLWPSGLWYLIALCVNTNGWKNILRPSSGPKWLKNRCRENPKT